MGKKDETPEERAARKEKEKKEKKGEKKDKKDETPEERAARKAKQAAKKAEKEGDKPKKAEKAKPRGPPPGRPPPVLKNGRTAGAGYMDDMDLPSSGSDGEAEAIVREEKEIVLGVKTDKEERKARQKELEAARKEALAKEQAMQEDDDAFTIRCAILSDEAKELQFAISTNQKAAESKNENLQYDMEQLTNKIARLNNKKAELGNEINNTLSEMSDVELAMNESLATRNEEHAAFQQAMKDDADAVELLGKAIEVLASVYPSLLQRADPADNEPESWAGGKAEYGGRQSEGTGIVSILEMIREDVENEMKVARQEEGDAMTSYEQLRSESTASLHALEAKKSALEQEEAGVDKSIASEEAKDRKSVV